MTPAPVELTLAAGTTTDTLLVRGVDLGELRAWIAAALSRRGWGPCEACGAWTPALSMDTTRRQACCPECHEQAELFGEGRAV